MIQQQDQEQQQQDEWEQQQIRDNQMKAISAQKRKDK